MAPHGTRKRGKPKNHQNLVDKCPEHRKKWPGTIRDEEKTPRDTKIKKVKKLRSGPFFRETVMVPLRISAISGDF